MMWVLPALDAHNEPCQTHDTVANNHGPDLGIEWMPCDCDRCLECPACITYSMLTGFADACKRNRWLAEQAATR